MNDLYSFYAQHHNSRVMHKWDHYFEIYDRFLSPICRSNPVVLEIGVQLGGSVEMWRHYFGPATRIYGIDINPDAKQQEDIITKVFIGDQQDRSFLQSVLREIGNPDLVIDDGGHTANQQITAFEELYPALSEDGLYFVEDTHTSLWGGPFMDRQDRQSFLQFSFARYRSVDGMDQQAGELLDPGYRSERDAGKYRFRVLPHNEGDQLLRQHDRIRARPPSGAETLATLTEGQNAPL